MELSIHHRSLLSGLLGGAVIVATACSGSDRAAAGRDTTQTATIDSAAVDTQSTAVGTVPGADTAVATASRSTQTPDTQTQDTAVESENQAAAGYQAMQEPAAATDDTSSRDTGSSEVAGAADTSITTDTVTARADTVAVSDSVAVGDSARRGKVGERLDSSVAAGQATADSLTGQAESDRVRPPEDSSETVGSQEDTSAADTSIAVVHADTSTAEQQLEVSDDSVTADQQIEVTTDTATADQQTAVAADVGADTVAVVGDSAEVGKTGERLEANASSAEANADTLATETERVRPPEDSTEVLGSVTNQEQEVEAEPADANADAAPVAAAGVQTTGNIATSAEAVSLMSRGGQPCAVVTGAESEDAEWDMASSPATMNPCGTGTMTLPRVQLEKEANQ